MFCFHRSIKEKIEIVTTLLLTAFVVGSNNSNILLNETFLLINLQYHCVVRFYLIFKKMRRPPVYDQIKHSICHFFNQIFPLPATVCLEHRIKISVWLGPITSEWLWLTIFASLDFENPADNIFRTHVYRLR